MWWCVSYLGGWEGHGGGHGGAAGTGDLGGLRGALHAELWGHGDTKRREEGQRGAVAEGRVVMQELEDYGLMCACWTHRASAVLGVGHEGQVVLQQGLLPNITP